MVRLLFWSGLVHECGGNFFMPWANGNKNEDKQNPVHRFVIEGFSRQTVWKYLKKQSHFAWWHYSFNHRLKDSN